jgi:hypothetical protein
MKTNRSILPLLLVVAALTAGAVLIPTAPAETDTPAELVAAYDALADTILAANATEKNLVLSIVATTYGHAEATGAKALAKLGAGESAQDEIETLAALVAQLGNEGDAAVAGIRKRLVEGGHHHHHLSGGDDEDSEYDEGFVIVTREAKQTFLDAAGRIGRMAGGANAAGLEAEWQTVASTYEALRAKHD